MRLSSRRLGQITRSVAAGTDAIDAIAFTQRPTAVSEPSTLALTLVGLTAVGLVLRRGLTVRTSTRP